MAWRRAREWKRSLSCELRELDAFRKCVRLERKAVQYPRAVPLLTELMNACRETGQDEQSIAVEAACEDPADGVLAVNYIFRWISTQECNRPLGATPGFMV